MMMMRIGSKMLLDQTNTLFVSLDQQNQQPSSSVKGRDGGLEEE
jgi:hypothetical protein